MDVELQATCSALGYQEGNEYIKEPDCLETVKDLIRFLRRDTDICDIRRQLGHAQIVQNDLIPLIKFYSKDKILFETVIKLLVNLTQPVITCFNNEIPDEKTLRNYCLEVENYLQDYKEAFIDDGFFCVVAEKIQHILKLEWDQRREEDKLQLERLFVLIRNILLIPPDAAREQRTDDDASIHDQILWTLHTSGIEDLILYMASSERERSMLCMHILEIISLMFREQEVETLASAGLQRSVIEKESDQRELEQARAKAQAKRKANSLKFSARHSRFGGTFVIHNRKSISDNNVIYHKPLREIKSFSYDDGKVPKKVAKNRVPIRGDQSKRRSTLSMRLVMKEFCVQFLVNAYNPLMRAVKDSLLRKTAQDNDETYYLWTMRFFMEFCRIYCKRVDLVSETMSMSTFHYIYTQLCTYYENLRLGKGEECKAWGRRSHLALKAYQELLRTLDSMTRSDDEQVRESAKVIQSNVFYMIEYRDVFITLLKNFKESKCSRAYLCDLVESTHIFLKMLEAFLKSSKHLVVQKKKGKKKRKSTTVEGTQDTEPSSEELEVLWNEVSSDLSALLEGQQEIPEGVTPFDAASDMDIEEQRIEAMLRVQASMREKNPCGAVALFRAAREVWPERDEFGSLNMTAEEEYTALQEIFMANLPRPHSQREGNDIEDEMEAVEEEEREETRPCEGEFDFKTFISDLAHQDVLKNYSILLSEFTTNSDSVNHCVVKMLHRLSYDLGYVGMLFQASIFKTFNSLLNGPYAGLARYKELSKFACYIVRQFTAVAQINKKLFVDLLFWKSKNEALALSNDYDFQSKSKGKVLWSEHEEQELISLYEKFRDVTHSELDTVDLILGELTSNHTRVQVLKELKKQGLITSAKDLKRTKTRSVKWTEEELQALKNAYAEHKNSNYPIAEIMKSLNTRKSKNSVIAKLLELGTVDDKKQLLKQRKGRRKSIDEDSSDEGERLFPETDRRKERRHKNSVDDNSETSVDDDNGEEVRLLVRQAASSVGDYVQRLIENGYRDQIAWIQRQLRNCAEDRADGVNVPTPIVPLTEENETAMEDEIFLIFLRSLGMTPPASQQEMFWRIPAEFSDVDLRKIADGLELSEEMEALGAVEIQEIVSGVFPALSSIPSTKTKTVKNKTGIHQRKKTKKKQVKRSNHKPGFQTKFVDHNESAVSEEEANKAISDIGGERNENFFTPEIPTLTKNNNTSDSDPEKMWLEKEDRKKKNAKVRAKERKSALKQMILKQSEKCERTNKRNKDSRGTKSSALDELPDDDSESGKGDNSLPPTSPATQVKTRKAGTKKSQVLESEPDSDSSSLSSLSPGQEDGQEKRPTDTTHDGSSGSKPLLTKSKKRTLDTDSDSSSLPASMKTRINKATDGLQKQKTSKRIRFLASDSDSDDIDNRDDDSQNQPSGNNDNENSLISEDISENNKAEATGPQAADSFPASLLSQLADSDDEDDQILLRTALKRRRAVVDDSDEN